MPHAATWLIWPHNAQDWPGRLQSITYAYLEMIRYIVRAEPIYLIVDSTQTQHRVIHMLQRAAIDHKTITFMVAATNRSWARDCGPIFLKDGQGQLVIADFAFTAWAKYPNFHLDDGLVKIAAAQVGCPMITPEFHTRRMVLEGGAIDLNGEGTLLTTEECLLDPHNQVRNPGYSKQDYEQLFEQYLGVQQTIWLNKGIIGDDTHGHVDDLCRFVGPRTVVLCEERNETDPHHRILEANRERLEGVRFAGGGCLQIIRLPMPEARYFDQLRLPLSYANFYITNTTVLVPVFNDSKDRIALGILAECFPDRAVIGIYAGDLIWGFGAIHCLTHEQPQ